MALRETQSETVQCPICSHDVPGLEINAHLDTGCSGAGPSTSSSSRTSRLSPSSSSAPSAPKPVPEAGRTKSTKSRSGQTKEQGIHPLFQKKAHSINGPEHSNTILEQSKKRAADDLAQLPTTKTQKRHKISTSLAQAAPLAERLRPSLLTEFVGQPHLTESGSLLMNSINNGSLGSMIFWGPPGCGKTTLARLVAKQTGSIFKELSATIVGINEVRPIFDEAKNALRLTGKKTILFLDEVHRFNRAQQDVFLPFLEQGHIQLIGATTENPSFKLTGALLSRCRVFVLERLSDANIEEIIRRAVIKVSPPAQESGEDDDETVEPLPTPPSTSQLPSSSPAYSLSSAPDPESSASNAPFPQYPHITERVLRSMTSLSSGDARTALSLLDLVLTASKTTPEEKLIEDLRRSVSASYDRTGDSRYDMISALHKSVRGSDINAAMYWLARMLSAGEDPLYIARRMVVCASEDIGLADNHALPLAMSALQACQVIGMPECRINLAHIVAYLAESPKSTRSYEAYNRAEAAARKDLTLPVPLQARNAPTKLMTELGYAEGYRYNPDYAHPVLNTYLPSPIEGQQFMRRPGDMSGKIWEEESLDWLKKTSHGKDEAHAESAGLTALAVPTVRAFLAIRKLPRMTKPEPEDIGQGSPRTTMPAVSSAHGGDEQGREFNVLLTGFGPFHNHKPVNPSWLAVKPLHNVIMPLDADPVVIDGQVVMRTPTTSSKHRTVKISALEIPVNYEAVMDIVPKLHLRPPVLPDDVKDDFFPLPSDKGYDFIFHVGVAGRGPLRMEKLGHKLGYHMKDATAKMAPIVKRSDYGRREEDVSVGEHPIERIGLGFEMESASDTYSARPNRGFGAGYEKFPDEIYTDIDVSRLVYDLRNSGIEQIYSSMDAGHYLCDFVYFCSLAESKRNGGKPYEKDRNTQVLFVHCPPVGQPLSTEEVTEAIRRIVTWVCMELAEIHDRNS